MRNIHFTDEQSFGVIGSGCKTNRCSSAGWVVLPDKRRTPKESKTWSHEEVASLDVSVVMEDAEDESGCARSRGLKRTSGYCNACWKQLGGETTTVRRWAGGRSAGEFKVLITQLTTGDVCTQGGAIGTPQPFTIRVNEDTARARHGKHKVEQPSFTKPSAITAGEDTNRRSRAASQRRVHRCEYTTEQH